MHDIWISLLNLDYRQRWACGACPAAPLLVLSDLLKKVVCWFFAESVWRKERSSQILNLKSRETFRLKEDKSKTPQNLVWMLQTCSVSTCRTVWFQREISPALCFFSFFFLPDFLGYSRFSAGSDSLMRVWILNPVQIWVFGSYVFASRSEQTVLVEVQPAGSGHMERTNVEWCLLTVFLIIFRRCCCCVCCLVCLPIQSQSTGFSWASPSLAKYMKVEKLYMRQYLRQSKCLKSPPPPVFKKENKRRGCPEDSWHRENIFTHQWKLKASLSSLIHTTTSFTARIQKGLCQSVSGTTSGISLSSSEIIHQQATSYTANPAERDGSLEKCTCSRSSTFDIFGVIRI